MNADLSPWVLHEADARLTLGALAGQVDFRRPLAGLQATFGGATLRLFQIELPPPSPSSQPTRGESPECYVRGRDLVCTYLQEDHRKIRGQAYLRALEWGSNRAPCIDLIVSVQTSLLDSDPTLNVRSSVTIRDAVAVTDVTSAATRDITPRGGDPATVDLRSPAPACWLFRLAAGDATYVEMVHPLDFVSSALKETAPAEVEHSTQLFHGPLEKGVILRSRLRGVFLPRAGDVAAAIACYQEFAASEPPLTA